MFLTVFLNVLADESIIGLFSYFSDGIGEGIKAMAEGVKSALDTLIYDGEVGNRVLATPFKFLLLIAGFGIGLSLIMGLLNLVKVEV